MPYSEGPQTSVMPPSVLQHGSPEPLGERVELTPPAPRRLGGCQPRMAGCRLSCLHKQLVMEYRAAREAAELAREAACVGYATEQAAYGPIVTFKSWLIGRAS